MKLLFYSPQFLPSVGGLQNVVHYWAKELNKTGHQVAVACTTAGQNDSFNYSVIRNPGFWQLVRLMRRADAIIMFNVSLKAMPQWWLSRRPLVISHHTAFRYEHLPVTWQQKIKRQVANRLAATNIACSQFIAKDYKRCLVVPNPFDNTLFCENQQLRHPNSLLFVGRLVSDKGADLLIDALAMTNARQPGQLHLTIVGDGPEEVSLRERIQKHQLQEQVNFAGPLPAATVAGLMNSHAIVVIPSRLEPFGLVVLEALSCGCEVVASNQGGLLEAGGNLVHYFETDSFGSLADVLLEVSGGKKLNDPVRRRQHLSQFSLLHSTTQLEQRLQEIAV